MCVYMYIFIYKVNVCVCVCVYIYIYIYIYIWVYIYISGKIYSTSSPNNYYLPIHKIMKIHTLCIKYNFFHYNSIFYKHKSSLPMDSPISGVLDCPFL